MSAVADGVGRAVCALTGAWRGEAAEPPTHSIADGTAEMHRGRGGSRHFRRHRGFIPEGSLFVSLRATGDLLTRADCLLSVRQKKCLNGEKTASHEHSELLIGGKKKIVRLLGK